MFVMLSHSMDGSDAVVIVIMSHSDTKKEEELPSFNCYRASRALCVQLRKIYIISSSINFQLNFD